MSPKTMHKVPQPCGPVATSARGARCQKWRKSKGKTRFWNCDNLIWFLSIYSTTAKHITTIFTPFESWVFEEENDTKFDPSWLIFPEILRKKTLLYPLKNDLRSSLNCGIMCWHRACEPLAKLRVYQRQRWIIWARRRLNPVSSMHFKVFLKPKVKVIAG